MDIDGCGHSPDTLQVGIAQIAPVWLNRAQTLAKVVEYVKLAAEAGCQMVAFGEALKPDFKEYQQQVVKNAAALAEALAGEGFRIVSGGTDNHMVLIDLSPFEVYGKEAVELLDRVGIHTNMNMIPYDERKPMDPSGLRVGTPALTTRGLGESEMLDVAKLMAATLRRPDDAGLNAIHDQVKELTNRFPIYSEL